MAARTYYLVIYCNGSGVSAALKSILTEENANIILQDKGNPTITRKEDNMKYQILDKRLFEYKNLDGTVTLFIISNAKRIK